MKTLVSFFFVSTLGACAPPSLPVWEGARAPHAVSDAKGSTHVAFVRDDRILVASERNGVFAEPVEVAIGPEIMAGFGRGPRLATSERGLCLVAIEKTGTMRSWTSSDAKAWKGPVDVTRVPGAALEGLHAIAGDGKQRVFACWVDLRTTQPELWGALSTDGGTTWSAEACVYRAPGGAICPCCAPSATYLADGRLVVMFRNEVEGSRDPWLATSTDGGVTFDAARKLGEGSWMVEMCPADGGAILAQDRDWVAVWQRDKIVYVTTPVVAEQRVLAGVLPAIAASGPNVWTGWQDIRDGTLTVDAPGGTSKVVARDVKQWSLCSRPDKAPLVVYESDGAVRCARL